MLSLFGFAHYTFFYFLNILFLHCNTFNDIFDSQNYLVKKYTSVFVIQSKTNFYSFHLDRRSGVLWRLLLRQNTRDVSYRHSEAVQKASFEHPF